jgi:putative acetyltransferase
MTARPEIVVRWEKPGDEAAIRWVNDQAFGQADESRIIDAIRTAGGFLISFVAVEGSTTVGHILFSPVSIETQGPQPRAMGLGPVAVAPDVQRQGIGSRLVESGLQECRRLGYQAVVVVGEAEFYPRFGFRPGRAYGLRCEFEVPEDVFMVLELTPGALVGVAGLVRYLPEFGGGNATAGPD